MCLIIHHVKGTTLTRATLDEIYNRNRHGFGLMYAENGTLWTRRFMGDAESIGAYYDAHIKGRECFLHWRLATHGDKNEANAHPFVLQNSGMAMMHNGILDCGTPDKAFSDTYHFAQYVLAPMARDNPNLLADEHAMEVLRPMIGHGNKVVLLDHTGRSVIINKAAGMVHEGCWYSNTYAWKAPVVPYVYPERGRHAGHLGWREGADGFGIGADRIPEGRMMDVLETGTNRTVSRWMRYTVEERKALAEVARVASNTRPIAGYVKGADGIYREEQPAALPAVSPTEQSAGQVALEAMEREVAGLVAARHSLTPLTSDDPADTPPVTGKFFESTFKYYMSAAERAGCTHRVAPHYANLVAAGFYDAERGAARWAAWYPDEAKALLLDWTSGMWVNVMEDSVAEDRAVWLYELAVLDVIRLEDRRNAQAHQKEVARSRDLRTRPRPGKRDLPAATLALVPEPAAPDTSAAGAADHAAIVGEEPIAPPPGSKATPASLALVP